MTTLSATKARSGFFNLLKRSVRAHTPIQITSKAGDAMLISKEDYDGLLETLKLLSTPGVFKGIQEARQDIKAERTKSMKEVFGK